MYARVARFEGADGDVLRRAAAEIGEQTGPPPGVPAKGFLMLNDADTGRSLAISLFETEDDMRKGDEALKSMNPQTTPDEGGGRRVSVEMYEVGADVRV